MIGAGTGAAIGGVAAGLAGASPVGLAASIIGGGVIGGLIGHSMDSSDSSKVNDAMDHNVPNKTTTWTNEKTGTTYEITPSSGRMTYKGNTDCRRFHGVEIMRNGKHHRISGVACRESNGSWKMMKHR